MKTGVISGFSRIHPLFDFRDLWKMVISKMTTFVKNLKDHSQIHPSYPFCDFSEIDFLRL